MHQQKGIAHIVLLLIVIVGIVFGGTVWFYNTKSCQIRDSQIPLSNALIADLERKCKLSLLSGKPQTMEENPFELCDLDFDGNCEKADEQIFNDAFGKCRGEPGYNFDADVDGDGCVVTADQQILFPNNPDVDFQKGTISMLVTDQSCVKETDCVRVGTDCSDCSCGEAVNKRFEEKYRNLFKNVCNEYKGPVCEFFCETPSAWCIDNKCTLGPKETGTESSCESNDDCWCQGFTGAEFVPGDRVPSYCNLENNKCKQCLYR